MFYYIANVQKGGIEVLRQSNEEEYNRIEKLKEPISSIFKNSSRIDPLRRAFKKISTINKSLLLQSEEYTIDDLSDAISNYLFAFRKFLDNWETYLKRQYGEASCQFNAFKKAKSDAYSNYIEYHIIYQLRNVDQHCDNIVSYISIGSDDDGANYIQAMTKCSYLLSVYSKWNATEKQHLQQLDEIDVFKYISVTQKCIAEVHQQALNSLFSLELYENCSNIINYSNEFFDIRSGLCFLCQEEELTKEYFDRPKKALNMNSWMVKQCVKLLSLHLKNNAQSAVIIYCGEVFDKSIKDFAVIVDKENLKSMDIPSLIKINDWPYRCCSHVAYLTEDAHIIVAVNSAVTRQKEKELTDRFLRYAQVLLGKSLK